MDKKAGTSRIHKFYKNCHTERYLKTIIMRNTKTNINKYVQKEMVDPTTSIQQNNQVSSCIPMDTCIDTVHNTFLSQNSPENTSSEILSAHSKSSVEIFETHLRHWAIGHHIAQTAISDLLKIIKSDLKLNLLGTDARTLLKTEYIHNKIINLSPDNSILLAQHDIDNIPIIPAENLTNINLTNLETVLKNIETEIKNVKEKQLEIQETTKLILAKINNEQYGKECSMLKDDKIKGHIPLTSIQDFLDFDIILENDEEAFMQIVNRILQIGGKNAKDFIRRALNVVFHDNLACMCSWTGQKNNFRIGDTRVMLGIKNAFKTTFPRSTEKDFEQLVMEWFRFANVRRQKKEPRSMLSR